MIRRLEKYELLEEIGHGGMATVYRARDERLDRLVAVKVLHPHLQKAREARIRFTREAKSVALLKHPNILEIYDYSGEGSPESYIATELLTGPTLKSYVESQLPELPAELAACFAILICRALGKAHEKGIIHRDVKPENVLLHENRTVKLTDFGIAQMVDAQSFTATGQILGSPGHMAPEQVDGCRVDVRTDVFSLGTVLYFLAVGRLPFTGSNPHQVLKRIMDGEYPDPLRVRPRVGGELAAIIAKAMARDPDARFANAAELESKLTEFVAFSGEPDPEALLVRFLADPETTAEELRIATLKALVERGRRAVAAGERARAMDDFNRVLALDEGNEEVLRQMERLGTRRGTRLRAPALIVLSLLALSGAAYGLFHRSATPIDPDPELAENGPDAGGPPRDAALDAARRDGGVVDGGAMDARAESDPSTERPQTARPFMRAIAASPIERATRVVRFLPQPQNVRIQVDEQPPFTFGPGDLTRTLRTGPHRIRVTNDACCLPLDRTIQVPPGEGEHELQLRLRYLSRLYIRANTPADVRVDNGTQGRTLDFIRVAMDDPAEAHSFTVTAPGHAVYTGEVHLRAGESTEVDVRLSPQETPL